MTILIGRGNMRFGQKGEQQDLGSGDNGYTTT